MAKKNSQQGSETLNEVRIFFAVKCKATGCRFCHFQVKFMDYRNLFADEAFRKARRIVFFGNQCSFDFGDGLYLFERLKREQRLLRILQPEHGLFSEQQDQVGKADELYEGIEARSLYDVHKTGVVPDASCFDGADALLVDIPDVGARYYTYTTHLYWMLPLVADLPVFIIDRPNLSGQQVEGTPLDARYASFVGVPGLLHRHGLSTGQLAKWLQPKRSMHIIPVREKGLPINLSPNIPTLDTVRVFAGQCFWEATSFSEGRGTTRPFEWFGHPDLSWNACMYVSELFNRRFAAQAMLRPMRFMPFFHKHANVLCHGFQLHILNARDYPVVFGSLFMMRLLRPLFDSDGFWRPGPYEFDSPCTAAQVLLGDDHLMDYVEGELAEGDLLGLFRASASAWLSQTAEL